jgi:hypothetical protein
MERLDELELSSSSIGGKAEPGEENVAEDRGFMRARIAWEEPGTGEATEKSRPGEFSWYTELMLPRLLDIGDVNRLLDDS